MLCQVLGKGRPVGIPRAEQSWEKDGGVLWRRAQVGISWHIIQHVSVLPIWTLTRDDHKYYN